MKNYEKPVVMVNEGLAEGVYAGSGDCWRIDGVSRTSNIYDGVYREFQVDATHLNQNKHRSVLTITITFNQMIEGIGSTGGATASGYSGQTATFTWDVGTFNQNEEKGWAVTVKSADPNIIEATSWSWSCGGIGVYE